jgi:amino acid permease
MATTDVEKRSYEGDSHSVVGPAGGEGGHMHRTLKGRQISMIAIAGTLGTGLFLGSGKALSEGGPVGAVLGYLIVGMLVGAMMYSLGEVRSFSSTFFRIVAKLHHPPR